MAELLKGAPVAAALTEALIERVKRLTEAGITPTLAIVRMGERPDDISYETGAMKRCEKIGVAVKRFFIPETASKLEFTAVIEHINANPAIHGCLMFRPLPDKELEEAACALLDPEKDVDCMTAGSLASVFTGKGAGYPPCTAQACMEILEHYGVNLTGKRVTVIGRSLVIGKPVSMMLQAKHATVTMCHTRTVDMPAICRNAEVIIAAAGKAGVVTADYVSPGQTVIDVGINVDENGKLCGDVDFAQAEPIVGAITPVPGGVGAVTTAVLAKHVVEAAEKNPMKRLKAFVLAVQAGICIALGGTVFLSLDNKVLGALFFTVGLFVICTTGLNLFTGKVCYVLEQDADYTLNLPIIWLGNLLGTWLTAFLERQTRIGPALAEKAQGLCETKLGDGLLSIFLLAVFCNMLIFIAVDGFKNNPHEVGKYLALFFGVAVFILCGFEHCVANMYYFSVAGAWSGKTLLYVLVMTAGNAVGGVIFPLLRKQLG